MRLGIQSGFKNADLRGWGCYFFTLCEMAIRIRRANGETFDMSDDDVIAAYEHCLKVGFIFTGTRDGKRITCWVKNPPAILNYLQNIIRFTQASHEINQPDALFYPVFFDGNLTHFALGSKGGVIWDSWHPSAEARGLRLAASNPYRWLR